MSSIQINYTSVTVVEVLLDALQQQAAEAQLIGKSGEALQRYVLHSGTNHLTLNNYPPGNYALRVSTEKEVAVKEIIIKNSF